MDGNGGTSVGDPGSQYARTFPTRASLIQYVKDIGRREGFAVIIRKSSVKDAWVRLGCDLGGDKRRTRAPRHGGNDASDETGCPFEVRGKKPAGTDEWVLEVRNLLHNHELSTGELSAHAVLRRLNAEEMETVRELTQEGVKPQHILERIHRDFPGNLSTIKTIYDARKMIRREAAGKVRASAQGHPPEAQETQPFPVSPAQAPWESSAGNEAWQVQQLQTLAQTLQQNWHLVPVEEREQVIQTMRSATAAIPRNNDARLSGATLPLTFVPLLPTPGVLDERASSGDNATPGAHDEHLILDPRITAPGLPERFPNR